ncbi:hypothetical protein F1880_006480 [Penicillium rolfsii]|nr:hypothetical protein F1880_006480 [Penicillium rolfsii]
MISYIMDMDTFLMPSHPLFTTAPVPYPFGQVRAPRPQENEDTTARPQSQTDSTASPPQSPSEPHSKRHQPHQDIIINDLPRMIIIEQFPLGFIHIQRQPTQLPSLERLNHSRTINQSSARGIHQQSTGFHPRQRILIDQMFRPVRQRTMQTDNMTLLQKRIQLDQHSRGGKSNPPYTYYPHRLPMERRPEQTLDVEVPFPHTIIRPVRLAVECLDQRDCELGDGFGGICWDVCDKEAEFLGGAEVDVIETCAAEENGADSACVQGAEDRSVKGVIDEDAYCVARLGEGNGEGVVFDSAEGRKAGGADFVEVGAVVGFGAEDGEFHGWQAGWCEENRVEFGDEARFGDGDCSFLVDW